MLLYHYTSRLHLPSILRDGVIETTESNVSWTRPHAAPDVVWLTTCDSPHLGHGLISVADKAEVRIAVEVPKDWAKRWKKWAKANGSAQSDMDILAESGGGWEAADTWFVCTRPIPKKYWKGIAVRE
jgi:hypothetical protein